ncbi:MAG TPA: hypothetical protein VMF03_13175 [Steroidobacteraceae bacterium]|nr:hypothetical protein [Steroidobacteraceae bacterium]
MKIALWTSMALLGIGMAGCGRGDNPPVTASMTGSGGTGSSGSAPGSSAPGSSSPGSSAPASSAPSDFIQFVDQQIGTSPALGSAPAATTSLNADLGLGTANAFASTPYGTGDAVPAGTFRASTACTQAGTTACNPATSADLNSNLN